MVEGLSIILVVCIVYSVTLVQTMVLLCGRVVNLSLTFRTRQVFSIILTISFILFWVL